MPRVTGSTGKYFIRRRREQRDYNAAEWVWVKPHSHTRIYARASFRMYIHSHTSSLISGRSIWATALSTTANEPLRKFVRHNQTAISFPSPTFQVVQVAPISLSSALNDFSSSLPARSPAAAADLLSARAADADRSDVHNRALALINRPFRGQNEGKK